ncbi:MAG: hypothetical protein RIE59_03085, partial [Imperialibacter sp.]
MKYLLELARENGLNNISERALENENVHGIIVSIDPIWLSYWQLLEGGGLEMSDLEELLFFDLRYSGGMSPLRDNPYFNCVTPIDLSWRPSFWDRFGNRSNIVVNIQLRPGSKFLNMDSIRSSDSSLMVQQIHSQVPRFATNPKSLFRPLEGGISVGAGKSGSPGTLGGVLKDNITGKNFALTCGHVASLNADIHQPANVDNPALSAKIGKCVYNNSPRINTGTVYNPRNPGSILNDMDVALIELDSGINANYSINNIGSVNGT